MALSIGRTSKDLRGAVDDLLFFSARVSVARDMLEELLRDETLTEKQHDAILDIHNIINSLF